MNRISLFIFNIKNCLKLSNVGSMYYNRDGNKGFHVDGEVTLSHTETIKLYLTVSKILSVKAWQMMQEAAKDKNIKLPDLNKLQELYYKPERKEKANYFG